MTIQNLEQKRAQYALEACCNDEWTFKTQRDADVVKPMTTIVMECGLLPAMAFALENKDPAYLNVFRAFIRYRGSHAEPEQYIDALARADSSILRKTTSDCLAYLKYLRRFANSGRESNE